MNHSIMRFRKGDERLTDSKRIFAHRFLSQAVSQAILKLYNYEPPWISNFSLPAQDADGWSILTPSYDSKVMYVSADGSDAMGVSYDYEDGSAFADWFDETGKMPFQTVEAAYAQCRDGFPDYVLCRCGDSFTMAGTVESLNGRSVSEKMVFSRYGSGARPVWNFASTYGLRIDRKSFVAMTGINLRKLTRDPDDPSFVDFDTITEFVPIYLRGEPTQITRGILIEGGFSRYGNCGFSINSVEDAGIALQDIIIRRNIFADTHKHPGGGHPQGGWAEFAEVLVEENIFANCGFFHDKALWAAHPHLAGTQYSHTLYVAKLKNSIIRNNISFDPSSVHFKFTSNPVGNTLAEALTGSAETQIVCAVPFKDLDPGGTAGLRLDDGTLIPVPYTSWSGNTLNIEPTDFSVVGASAGKPIVVNVTASKNLSIYGNLCVGGEAMMTVGGNKKTDLDKAHNSFMPRWANCFIYGNVGAHIGQFQPTNRDFAWGPKFEDQSSSTIADNLIIGPDNAAVVQRKASQIVDYQGDIEQYNNIALNMGNFAVSEGVDYSNAASLVPADFVAPDNDIESYQNGTFADFKAVLLAKTRENWNISHTAFEVNKYLREAHALKAPKVLSDIADRVVEVNKSIAYTVDAIWNCRVSGYQWFKGDEETFTPVSGETGRTYTYTPTSINESGTQVYGEITFDDGTVISTTVSTVTVNPVAQTLTFGGGVCYASITGFDQASVNDTVSGADNFTIRIRASFADLSSWVTILGDESGNYAVYMITGGEQIRWVDPSGTMIFNFSTSPVAENALVDLEFKRVDGTMTLSINDDPKDSNPHSHELIFDRIAMKDGAIEAFDFDAQHLSISNDTEGYDIAFNMISGSTTSEAADINTGQDAHLITYVGASGRWS